MHLDLHLLFVDDAALGERLLRVRVRVSPNPNPNGLSVQLSIYLSIYLSSMTPPLVSACVSSAGGALTAPAFFLGQAYFSTTC